MMRYRIGRAFAFVGATLLIAACTASDVDPDARIEVGGAVRRQSGEPVPGVRVALAREADAGEVFTVFATLGLACIDAQTNVCLGGRVARTGPDGRFAYTLTGKDTQGFLGQASTMVLTSGIGPREEEVAGPITTYRFQVQTELLDLPVRTWEPRLEGRTGPFGARVTWTPLPGSVVPGLSARSAGHAIEFRRGEEAVWRVDRARSGFAFDARVLEDSTGTAAVVATLDDQRVEDERGRRIDVVLRSGARAYDSPAGAPSSRGAQCSVTDARGRAVPQSPCRLTDGELADDFAPSVCTGATGCTEPTHTSTVIDLRARRSLSLVVVRGCANRCTVDTSRDGRAWRAAGVASAEDVALRISPPVSARYVRVSSSVSIAGLREVSAWAGASGVPAGSLFVDPAAVPPPGSPGATASPRAVDPAPRSSGVWRLIALGALCAVLGALVATLVTHRKRRGSAPR